jgi:hypothetical protein
VYADYDPIVLLHAKVLLADSPESRCEDTRQRGVSTRLSAPAGLVAKPTMPASTWDVAGRFGASDGVANQRDLPQVQLGQ